jgi:hypothetical protein
LETASSTISGVVVSGELEVAMFSPPGAPGVLDEPVVFALLVTISYNEDTMIEISAAAKETTTAHDTSEIELEGKRTSINCNRYGTFSDSTLHGLTRVGRDILETLDFDRSSFSMALSVENTSVGILVFGLDGSLLSILESRVHKTTTATLVSFSRGAVNKLLLRE